MLDQWANPRLCIGQDDDRVLHKVALPFVSVGEAAAFYEDLADYVARLALIYPFTKGMGLAAPQTGVARTLALVRPPDTDTIVALLNPVVTWQSSESDEQYEGCLSFLEVDTPGAWFFGCLLLWIVFFPLYMARRDHVG